MDRTNWLPIILVIAFLVFCCGPMLWMSMGKKSRKHEWRNTDQGGES